jgi:hypothetical protein
MKTNRAPKASEVFSINEKRDHVSFKTSKPSFTILMCDGRRLFEQAPDINHAYAQAGITREMESSVDMWCFGNDQFHTYDQGSLKWIIKVGTSDDIESENP